MSENFPPNPGNQTERSSELLELALLDKKTDPEVVLNQAIQSGFVERKEGRLIPSSKFGEDILGAYEERIREDRANDYSKLSSASEGSVDSDIQNIEDLPGETETILEKMGDEEKTDQSEESTEDGSENNIENEITTESTEDKDTKEENLEVPELPKDNQPSQKRHRDGIDTIDDLVKLQEATEAEFGVKSQTESTDQPEILIETPGGNVPEETKQETEEGQDIEAEETTQQSSVGPETDQDEPPESEKNELDEYLAQKGKTSKLFAEAMKDKRFDPKEILKRAIQAGYVKKVNGNLRSVDDSGDKIISSYYERLETDNLTESDTENGAELNQGEKRETQVIDDTPATEHHGETPEDKDARIASEIRARREAQESEVDLHENEHIILGEKDKKKVLEKEKNAEAKKLVRNSELGKKIADQRQKQTSVEKPPKYNIAERAFLYLFKHKEYKKYIDKVDAKEIADKKLKELDRLESDWIRREAKLIVQAENYQKRLTELISQKHERILSKTEQRELDKITNHLLILRKNIDEKLLPRLAQKAGITDYKSAEIPWEGLVENETLQDNERAEKIKILDKIKKDKELYKLFMGLKPETQDLFLREQAGESLRETALAIVRRDMALESLDKLLKDNGYIDDPNKLYQLVAILKLSENAVLASEESIKDQLKSYAFRQSNKELVREVKGRIKKTLGKVLETYQNFEIDYDTSVKEIILHGNNELSEVISGTMELAELSRVAANRTAKGARLTQRLSHRGMDKFLRVREGYLIKEKEISEKIAVLDVKFNENQEMLDHIRSRNIRPKKKGPALKEYVESLIPEGTKKDEIRRAVVTKILGDVSLDSLGLRGMLSQAETREIGLGQKELFERYNKEGFTIGFSDDLTDFIEQTIGIMEKIKTEVEQKLREIETQKQRAEGDLDREEEKIADEWSHDQEFNQEDYKRMLVERERLLTGKIHSLQSNLRLRVTALEGRVEKEAIKHLRKILS